MPTYTLSSDFMTIIEGQTIIINLTTTDVNDGTQIPYTVTGIDPIDLTSGSLTGNFTVENNTSTQSFRVAQDRESESTETFVLTLDNNADSISINILNREFSETVQINLTVAPVDTVKENAFFEAIGNEVGKRIKGRKTTVANRNEYYPKFVEYQNGYRIVVSEYDFQNSPEYENDFVLYEPVEYRYSLKNPYLVTQDKVFYLTRKSLNADSQENILWSNQSLFFYDDDITFGPVITFNDANFLFNDNEIDFNAG